MIENLPVQQLVRRTDNKTIKRQIDQLLLHYFETKVVHASDISEDYAGLLRAMKDLVLSGGKRLRPYITILSYRAYRGSHFERIQKIAMAQELLHLAMLIHDDVIDRDTIRYGVANVSGVYQEKYARFSEGEHYAMSNAILAGDVAIASAYELIATSGFEAIKISGASQQLSDAIFYVAGGEMLDTETAIKDFADIDPLLIAEYKTAKYSCISPLVMGAYFADAPEKEIGKLKHLGKNLGIGFQLVDDMLGVFGDESVTGKSAISDLREGKKTVLMRETYRRASNQQRRVLDRFFGSPEIDHSSAEIIREIIVRTGAKKHADGLIQEYSDNAKQKIDELQIDEGSRDEFMRLQDALFNRSK